jgi:hypothetical protein
MDKELALHTMMGSSDTKVKYLLNFQNLNLNDHYLLLHIK